MNERLTRGSLYLVAWIAALGFTLSGCASARPTRPRLELDVHPNPVIVRKIWGEIWEIPFEIHLRETAGVDVQIERVTLRVLLGTSVIYTEVLEASNLTEMGLSPRLKGGQEIHHLFRSERFIPNVRLLSNVVARLEVRAAADDGQRVEAAREVGFATKSRE